MSSAKNPGPAERVLLAAGTASYDSREFQDLGKVPDALQAIVGALKELGFTTVVRPPGYRLDPGLASLRAVVRKAAEAAPVVVVYYTGHGADLERDTYYLVSKKSRPADLGETGLAARDLLTLLTLRDSRGGLLADQPTVLVILDCCYSGSAGMTMLGEALHGIGNANTWVIATAGALEYAQQGLFATAFCEAMRRPTTGPSQRFVHPLTIVDAVNDALDHAQQQALLFQPATGAAHIPPFFPNLSYQPGLAGMTVADQQHWLSRLRGGPQESTVGFYLTGKAGRLRAARHLAEWITDPEPRNLALVTGSPGTGKSALLALLTLLTERTQRQGLLRGVMPGSLIAHTASLIPAETPVAAVHARGLNTDQAAGAIAQALGRDASTASRLLEVLDTSPQHNDRVVVVDAVDEAISPATMLGALLVPLSRQPRVRVVVGARRHALAAAGDADMTVDLDAADYRDPEALTDYIHRLLIAAEEPGVTTCYTPRPGTATAETTAVAAVARTIAQRATAGELGAESFLVGRLLALSVRDRPQPANVTSPAWQSELPTSVAGAFEEDLARLRDRQPLARALLEALAWAKGPGLPWETIWVLVARALAELDVPEPPPITNDDVRWLLDKAGAYVVEDAGPGERSVYRPFHDLLSTHLRGEPSTAQIDSDADARRNWEQDRRRTEQTITNTLLATVPADRQTRRDWISAHPYLRTYLAQHAAGAGTQILAALIADKDFLAVADPITLSPLLPPANRELRDAARIYRRARPVLGEDAHANAAYLQEAEHTLFGTVAASDGTAIRPLYRTRLGSVLNDASLLELTGHGRPVESVAFGTTADGQLLLASAGDDGTVRLWDPLTGAPFGEPLTSGGGAVMSVAFGTTADGRLLLASAEGRAVRLWDPLTSTPASELLVGHSGGVTSMAFGTTADGRLLLASASHDDGTVRLCDPLAATPIGEPLIAYKYGASEVAFGTTADGRLLLASAGAEETVRLWDPLTGAPASPPLTGHRGSVRSVAFGTTADGQLLLASADINGTIRLRDPLTGISAGPPFTATAQGLSSVTLGTTADGRLLLASAGLERPVRLWDPLTGVSAGPPLTGHTNHVYSVAFGTTAGGQLLLASASQDETARLWDPLTSVPAGPALTDHMGPVSSVAFGTTAGGQLLLASAGDDVQLWDPLSGAHAGEPLTGHRAFVRSVAFGATAAGRLLLASASLDGTVRLWDPLTRVPAGPPLIGHTGQVHAVAFGTTADGRLLLASAGTDETVRLWDPLSCAPAGEPLTPNAGHVSSVAFGTTADGQLLLASACENGTVRLWDPLTGTSAGEPLTGHSGSVSAVAFGTTANGQLLLASASDRTVRLSNALTGTPAGEPLTPDAGWIRSIALSTTADGHLLIAAGGDARIIRLRDLASGTYSANLRRRSPIWSIALRWPLLAIGEDEGLCVVDLS